MFVGGSDLEGSRLLGHITVKPCAVVFATKALRHEARKSEKRKVRSEKSHLASKTANGLFLTAHSSSFVLNDFGGAGFAFVAESDEVDARFQGCHLLAQGEQFGGGGS